MALRSLQLGKHSSLAPLPGLLGWSYVVTRDVFDVFLRLPSRLQEGPWPLLVPRQQLTS